MKNIKNTALPIVILIFAATLLAGCVATNPKAPYFNGSIMVERNYYHSNFLWYGDTISLHFTENGTYDISFIGSNGLEDFSKTINNAPQDVIIKEDPASNFLRITIKKQNISEFHEFYKESWS